MELFTNKKLLILIGSFLILFIIFIASLFLMRNNNQNPTTPSPVPTVGNSVTRPVSVSTPTDIPVIFTGQKDDVMPSDQADAINKSFELRQQLPIEESGFSIDYDYAEGHYIVTIQTPHEENKTRFNEWIQTNGYGAIDTEEFVIQLQ